MNINKCRVWGRTESQCPNAHMIFLVWPVQLYHTLILFSPTPTPWCLVPEQSVPPHACFLGHWCSWVSHYFLPFCLSLGCSLFPVCGQSSLATHCGLVPPSYRTIPLGPTSHSLFCPPLWKNSPRVLSVFSLKSIPIKNSVPSTPLKQFARLSQI